MEAIQRVAAGETQTQMATPTSVFSHSALVSLRALGVGKTVLTGGWFPREVLAQQNLAFDDYRTPVRRNRPETHDAKVNGPSSGSRAC